MQLCTCSTLFLCISLSLFCTTTTWNFQKRLSYTFFGGNVVRVLVHLFFTAAHFHLALVAASISHFVTAPTKFSCCSSNKKCILCYIRVELRWPAAYFLLFSVFLFLYIPNLWTSTLNTLDIMDKETISAFRFRLYWLFSCLCFTRRRWLCDFPPK